MTEENKAVEAEQETEELTEVPTAEPTEEEAEEQRYKQLYEELQEEMDGKRSQAIEDKRETLLKQAGYKPDQVERYKQYISGESEKEMQGEITKLMIDFPPKKSYVDPASRGNGVRQRVKKGGSDQAGRKLFKRLRKSGKIRRKI